MSDIKKYTNPVLSEDSGMPEYVHGGWVKYTDHAKAIESKDKEIEVKDDDVKFWKESAQFNQKENMKRIKKQIEQNETIAEQAKEIERLKDFIKPITEIGEPDRKGYFNLSVNYDFVKAAKELTK